MIKLKSEREIHLMRQAGAVAAQAMELVGKSIRPGMTTQEVDDIFWHYVRSRGGKASFYHYGGFPGHICISINDEIVHGIPGDRVIQEGDIVSVDLGVELHGYQSDKARTFFAGDCSAEARRLVEVTEQSFFEALKFCYPGKRLGDIGHAVQALAEENGYSVVRVLTGHGIGKQLHEDPEVRNYGKPNTGEVLKEGMVLAIEPMVNEGTHRVYELDDDWTCVTADGKLSAHYENTVAITKDGPVILTALPEES